MNSIKIGNTYYLIGRPTRHSVSLQAYNSSGVLTGGVVRFTLSGLASDTRATSTGFYYNSRLYFRTFSTSSGNRWHSIPVALPLASRTVTVRAEANLPIQTGLVSPASRRFWAGAADIRYYPSLDGSDAGTREETLPAGLTFDPDSNSAEFDSNLHVGNYDLTHLATDEDGDTAQATVRFEITAAQYANLIANDLNVRVTKRSSSSRLERDITGSGGRAPLTLNVDLDTPSRLSGVTDVTAGSRYYLIIEREDVPVGTHMRTITVTDARGRTATGTFSIVVDPAIALSKPTDVKIQYNQRALTSVTLPAATGGDGRYTYELSHPAGVAFNPTTRVMSFSNRVLAGDHTLTYKVTDGDGATVSQQFNMQRLGPPTHHISEQIANIDAYKFAAGNAPAKTVTLPTATATPDTGPYTYRVDGLVSGITFNATTRVLTYNPEDLTVGTDVSLTYVAVDAEGREVTQGFTVVTHAAMRFQAQTQQVDIDDDTVLTALRLPLAVGGSGMFTYEISDNPTGTTTTTTPPVLNYNNSVAAGTTTVTYKATDTVSGDSVTQTFDVVSTVTPLTTLVIPTIPPIPYVRAVQNVRVLPPGKGGTAPLSYAMTGLPAGASFNTTTRALTLEPSIEVGVYRLTYAVTDSHPSTPQTVRASVELDVTNVDVPSALVLLQTDDLSFEEGTPKTITMQAAEGGTLPYTYGLTKADGNPLPLGMSFNAAANTLSIDATAKAGRYLLRHSVYDVSDPVKRTAVINVVDVARQVFVYPPINVNPQGLYSYQNGRDNVALLPVATGGSNEYTYSVEQQRVSHLPPGFTFDPDTRRLNVRAGTPVGESELKYVVIDSQGTKKEVDFRVLLTPTPFDFPVPLVIPPRVSCAAEIVSVLNARFGVPPYTFSLGTPNEYFTVSDNVLMVAGDTPTGTYNLTVEARDSDTASQSHDITVRVTHDQGANPVCPPLQVLPHAGEELKVSPHNNSVVTFAGIGFSVDLPTAPGAKYYALNVPEGVEWDETVPRVSGKLPYAGEYPFIFKAVDAEGRQFVTEFTLYNREVGDVQSRFNAARVYTQDDFKDLHNAARPLDIDVSFMAVYKDSLQMQARFFESGGNTIMLRAWGKEDEGNFHVEQRGSERLVRIAPDLIGELLDLVQAGKEGVFVIELRSYLEPGNHVAEFSSGNVPVQALQAEFTRLDIQDRSKNYQLTTENNVVATKHIEDTDVTQTKLARRAVRRKHMARRSVDTDQIAARAVETRHLQPLHNVSIRENSLQDRHIHIGAVSAAKLSRFQINPKSIDTLTGDELPGSKVKDDAVQGSNFRSGAIGGESLTPRGVTGSKVPRGALRLTVHAPEVLNSKQLTDNSVRTEHIQDGAVQERHLTRDLKKYTTARRGAADLVVANPDNIQNGEPVGIKMVNGVPTAFRLTGSVREAYNE